MTMAASNRRQLCAVRFDGRRESPRDVMDAISSLLGPAPVSVDDLVRASGFGVAQVHAALFDLELGGRLVRHGGNMVALLPRIAMTSGRQAAAS